MVSVLKTLHKGHVGMVQVKRIVRSYAWLPGVNKDIEELAKSCNSF